MSHSHKSKTFFTTNHFFNCNFINCLGKIVGLSFLVLSCNNSTEENLQSETLKADTKVESNLNYNPNDALWGYQFDAQINDFKIVKLRQFSSDTLTTKSIESIINKTWPKVQIQFLKSSNDTVYLSIPQSEVLTQQMGSSGASHFIGSTIYSFTELKGIKYVSFDFEEGDHAAPGVFGRRSEEKISP